MARRLPWAPHPHVAAAAAGHPPARIPSGASPLSRAGGAAAGFGARRCGLLQQCLRPRRAPGSRRRARLLLPHAVSLRLARARARACGGAGAAPPAAEPGSCAHPALGLGGTDARHPLRGELGVLPAAHRDDVRARRRTSSTRRSRRHRFTPAEPEDFFLTVTELVRHKRVEVALEAARRAGAPIKVVGTGPDLERLKTVYDDSAEFLGRVVRRGARGALPALPGADRAERRGVRDRGGRGSGRRAPGDRS